MLSGYQAFFKALGPVFKKQKSASKGLILDGLTNPDFVFSNITFALAFINTTGGPVYYTGTNKATADLYNSLGFLPLTTGKFERFYSKLYATACYYVDLYVLKKIDLNSNILELNIEGIKVGDLLLDTVQRFDDVKKYELDFRASNFIGWIKLTYLQFYIHKRLLTRYSVQYLTISHKYYIYYGIAPRIALNYGIQSFYVVCNSVFRIKELNDLYYSEHHFNRDAWKSLNSVPPQIINDFLDLRFSGGYKDMCSERPFSGKRALTKDQFITELNLDPTLPICTVYLHAFGDANHYEQEMLFNTYYEWFIKTLQIISEISTVNWIFKEHPYSDLFNEVGALNKDLTVHGFSGKVIPNDISAVSVLKWSDSILTVRGTVGMEAPIFNIEPITCGYSYYREYGFTKDCDSVSTYTNALRNIDFKAEVAPQKKEIAKKLLYCISNWYITRSQIAQEFFDGLLNDDQSNDAFLTYANRINASGGILNDDYTIKMHEFILSDRPHLTGIVPEEDRIEI